MASLGEGEGEGTGMRCAAPEGAIIGGGGSVRGTAGSNPYANDLARPWPPWCERGGVAAPLLCCGRAGGVPRRGGVALRPPGGASGDGGMTRNDNRTDHWSLTPDVPKSGVAPEGMARAKPMRAESSTIS